MTAFQEATMLRNGGDSFDWFFLATFGGGGRLTATAPSEVQA